MEFVNFGVDYTKDNRLRDGTRYWCKVKECVGKDMASGLNICVSFIAFEPISGKPIFRVCDNIQHSIRMGQVHEVEEFYNEESIPTTAKDA